jgi:hypothetical protein
VHHFEEVHPCVPQIDELRVNIRDFIPQKITVNNILPQFIYGFQLLFIEGVMRVAEVASAYYGQFRENPATRGI